MGQGFEVRIRGVIVQTTLSTQPGLGTQPHYVAPGYLWLENVKHSD